MGVILSKMADFFFPYIFIFSCANKLNGKKGQVSLGFMCAKISTVNNNVLSPSGWVIGIINIGEEGNNGKKMYWRERFERKYNNIWRVWKERKERAGMFMLIAPFIFSSSWTLTIKIIFHTWRCIDGKPAPCGSERRSYYRSTFRSLERWWWWRLS